MCIPGCAEVKLPFRQVKDIKDYFLSPVNPQLLTQALDVHPSLSEVVLCD